MKRRFAVIIEEDEDGILVGSAQGLPGCHSQGDTLDELMENMKEAIEAHVELLKRKHEDIPPLRFKGISEGDPFGTHSPGV